MRSLYSYPSSRAIRIVPLALASLLAATAYAGTAPNADALTFRQSILGANLDPIMGSPFAARVSPDGNDIYVTAFGSATLVHFLRDIDEGTVTFFESVGAKLNNAVPSIPPLDAAVSPNGRFLHVAMTVGGALGGIARYDRNLQTGAITFGAGLPADTTIVPGIHNPFFLAPSPDGRHLYVLSGTYTLPPYYTAALAVVATDPATGAMAFVQKIDLFNNLPPSPVNTFDVTVADLQVSPDGNNVYVARAFNESVDAYTRNAASGELSFLGATYLRASPRGFVISVAVSPDGKHVYATEGIGGTVYVLDRAANGALSLRPFDAVSLAFPGRIEVSPDGARAYIMSVDSLSGQIGQVNAFGRDPVTGTLTLLERVSDRESGAEFFSGAMLPAVSPDSRNLYVPASRAFVDSLTAFSVERPELPCEDFPLITDEYDALAAAYDLYDDLDSDGVPEVAALALLEEASCANENDGFDEAITNAYLLNLSIVNTEVAVAATGVLAPYTHALASLVSLSEITRMYLNLALENFSNYSYVPVTCVDGACEPADSRGEPGRSSVEPFAGEGDPDGDGFTNAQEWAAVLARGGSVREFAVSALDPANDGETVVTFESGNSSGSCFIATAAYGTPLAGELYSLRDFRDRELLTNGFGAAFTDAYYRLSPPAADFIARHDALRALSRVGLSALLRADVLLSDPGHARRCKPFAQFVQE